jgi:hypothetical protein
LEANRKGMEKLNMLSVEQCEDGWPIGKCRPGVCNLTWD